MNRCLYTYLQIHTDKKKENFTKYIEDKSQIIENKPLPFINGKLAPASYFYDLFSIGDLNSEKLNNEEFKPKIFLVIDKKLDGKIIKIGDLVLIRLVYVEEEKES